ncbi:MAG: glycosyltransferase [Sphingobacteriia bacterium]|nr:glycosyltransferase [Paludibacteraceae bacterium]NCA78849.1 glycosyltransferase [Sphingobacteriia bacterium]
MKITILGTAYPYRGGLATFNERLARQFQAEGHEVDIVTFTMQYPSFLFPGKTQYSNDSAPTDLHITRRVNSINPFNWLKIGRKISKRKPDLLIIKFWLPFMSPCLGTIARIVRCNKKTRVISILDNIIPHEKRFADKLFASYFAGSVDGFVAMSQSVLKDVELFDKQKPKKFCPHPLYDNFGEKMSKTEAATRLNVKPDTIYLLFFGFIRDYKGLDLLLQAFADTRFRALDVKLIVAGEFYNNSERYFKLEQALGLNGNIIWHNDFIPDSEVKYFFNLADIIVQPYKSATQSGVTQIAYHFEKPMLVTNVGGLAEIVPNGKVGYVTDTNPIDIADALIDFCSRKPDFSAGIREEKQKYAWSNMTNAIINIS